MRLRQGLSGQKLAADRPDPGLTFPFENFPPGSFSEGWREKRLSGMSGVEIDRLFDEFLLLVMHEGVKM